MRTQSHSSIFRRILIYCTLGLAIVRPANAMSFNVEAVDVRPIQRIHYYVYGSGKITEGDTQRLFKILQNRGVKIGDDISIYLDSPGGSVSEGMRLGRLISGVGADTDVGRRASGKLATLPGICASACVLTYLGGNYRFLQKGSKLGVHQFSISDDKIQVGTAMAVTQIVAAEIVEYIKNSRADLELFTLMTSALPSDIYFIPDDKLRKLRVVTDAVFDEQWSFEFNQGYTYLRIWQQSYYGENKLILACQNHHLIGTIITQPPPSHMIGKISHTVGVFINGDLITIPDKLVIEQPKMGSRFATAFFNITPDLATKMLAARSIGAALQPPNKDIFIDFQIDTSRGADKLSKMIWGCK